LISSLTDDGQDCLIIRNPEKVILCTVLQVMLIWKGGRPVVMGPVKNFWPGSGQFFVACVRSGQPFMVWVWISKISIFSLRVRQNCFGSGRKVPGSMPSRPLIYCGSKVSSGRVRSGPISSRRRGLMVMASGWRSEGLSPGGGPDTLGNLWPWVATKLHKKNYFQSELQSVWHE